LGIVAERGAERASFFRRRAQKGENLHQKIQGKQWEKKRMVERNRFDASD